MKSIFKKFSRVFNGKKLKFYQMWFFIFNLVIILNYQLSIIEEKPYQGIPKNRTIKSILLWNSQQRAEVLTFGFGGDIFQQQQCQVTECEIVVSQWQYPHRSLDSYDAILVNLNDQIVLDSLPNSRTRQLHQRYIFFTQEPPSGLEDYDRTFFPDNYFNWTMTFRLDSDIPLIYGRIRPAEEPAPTSFEQVTDSIQQARLTSFASGKTKLVAWMVSHCETDGRREDYVRQLKRYIDVDIYGDCGKLECDRSQLFSSRLDCFDMIESKYKFYLSFENSICQDYVTEKFFNIMKRNIIPVVYGGVNYSRIAPPHSFIDARQYEPKELADYLLLLNANDTLYDQYFWWKSHYIVEADIEQMARRAFCNLCEKLHNDRTFRTHTNLTAVWKNKEGCILTPKRKRKTLSTMRSLKTDTSKTQRRE